MGKPIVNMEGNVFSSLAKGKGTWKGKLELDFLVDLDKEVISLTVWEKYILNFS